MILANSLIEGFLGSNIIGRLIVIVQAVGALAVLAIVLGKLKQMYVLSGAMKRFSRDFSAGEDVLEYYMRRRPAATVGLEGIYRATCDHLLRIIPPEARMKLAGRTAPAVASAALTAHELELVNGTCAHVLEEQQNGLEQGMGMIATIVALEPMLGLLGTVWGVLDAFADMGTAGSANLATIAPSISAALVTTVAGLLAAIPGVAAFNYLNKRIDDANSKMEAFADNLTAQIACEFQGTGV